MRTIKVQCPKTGKPVEYPADKVIVLESKTSTDLSGNYGYTSMCSAQEFVRSGRHPARQPR